MSRGRPPNLLRAAARKAKQKTYIEQNPCAVCGTNLRYTSNTACVACSIERGKAKYAALDEAQKAAHKASDHARYLRRGKHSRKSDMPATADFD